jgi:cell division protein FtsL
MVPLSLGRPPLATSETDPRRTFAWLRPANIAAAHSEEVRALIAWLAVFVMLGVLIALGHVYLRLKVVDLGYRLSATRQLVGRLEQERHELTVEAATLNTAARLEEVAGVRLGMTRPEKGVQKVLP